MTRDSVSFTTDSLVIGLNLNSLSTKGFLTIREKSELSLNFRDTIHLRPCDRSTVAVALWAMENKPVTPNLQLTIDGVFEGGVGGVTTDNPKWSSVGRTI